MDSNPKLGLGPMVQPSPPGWVQPNRPGPGSVKPTQSSPSLAPLSLSSPSGKPKLPPPSPADSGRLWRPPSPTHGANGAPQRPLPPSSSWIWRSPPLREIPCHLWLGFRRLWSPSSSLLHRWLSWCLWCTIAVVAVAGRHRWKRPRWVLPVLRCHRRWSHPQAAPGRLRGHCLAMSARDAPRRE
jgi:hypothetical protein